MRFERYTLKFQVELKKMAVEGYMFAKLPKCYQMPQLQDWIMYRKGVAFSEMDKSTFRGIDFFYF